MTTAGEVEKLKLENQRLREALDDAHRAHGPRMVEVLYRCYWLRADGKVYADPVAKSLATALRNLRGRMDTGAPRAVIQTATITWADLPETLETVDAI